MPRARRPSFGRTWIARRSLGHALVFVTMGLALSTSLVAATTAPPFISTLKEDWRWAQYTVADGLPVGPIQALTRDPQGQVWVASPTHVARFDGYRWHVLANPSEVVIAPIRCLVPGRTRGVRFLGAGTLYSADHDGLHAPETNEPGKAAEGLTAIAHLPGGDLLVQRGSTITRRTLTGEVVVPNPELALNMSYPLSLRQSSNGTIWLGARSGLYIWDGSSWKLRLPMPSNDSRVEWASEDGGGLGFAHVKIPGALAGFWEWSPTTAAVRAGSEGHGPVDGVAFRKDGTLLAVHDDGTVRIRTDGHWATLEPTPPAMRDVSLVTFGSHDELWIGTSTGLSHHASSSTRWTRRAPPFPDFRRRILEVARTADGALWVGTSAGLEIHHPGGRIEIVTALGDAPVLPVTAIGQDAEGHVWIGGGVNMSGVYRFDGKKWRHYGETEGFTDDTIHRIVADRSGRLWFLGIAPRSVKRGPGAFVWMGDHFEAWGSARGLSSGRVYSFGEDSRGGLWFGTVDGVERWTVEGWTRWTEAQGLASSRAFALTLDPRDRAWVGHQQACGVSVIHPDGSITIETRQDGLSDDNVWGLATDLNGGVWAATKGGLSLRHPNGSWSRFSTQEGLPAQHTWVLAPERDRIHVGTWGNGLATLSFAEATLPLPSVQVDAHALDGTSAHVEWRPAAWQGHVRTSRIDTRHRLDDGPWSKWDTTREATLTGLSPGEHVIEIQAKGLFGDSAKEGAKAVVLMPRKLWQRVEFLAPILSLLALLFGVTLVWRWHQRQNLASIRDLQDRLFQAAKLEAVGRLAGGIAHDFNNLLTVILGATSQAKAAAPDQSALTEQLEEIEMAADRASSLTSQLLTFARKQPLREKVISLGDLLLNMEILLARVLGQDVKLKLTIADAPLPVKVDPVRFEQVFTNLAVNARDAMPHGGHLDIGARLVPAGDPDLAGWEEVGSGAQVEVTVSDDGTGMDEATLSRVFEPFFTTKSAGKGTGLGLAMMHGIVQVAGGQVRVASKLTEGTTFTVRLPLSKEPLEAYP